MCLKLAWAPRKLGILPETVQQALQVRQNFSWAAKVPEEVWRDYVLPYASVNEARWALDGLASKFG